MIGPNMYEQEREVLVKFLDQKRSNLADEVVIILNTLLELISNYTGAVKEFDLQELHEFIANKAEEFYKRFRGDNLNTSVKIVKDEIYVYHYSSISFKYSSLTFLYPFMLVRLANYRNFVQLLCRRLEKVDARKISLVTFIDVYSKLLSRSKPKIDAWDMKLLKELANFNFCKKNWHVTFIGFENNKRFLRLKHLGVQSLYYDVNFPSLGLVPYIHLADSKIRIPVDLKTFIELEDHPAKKKKNYKIFRLFLLPNKIERKLTPVLRDLGTLGKLEEWYVKYNWDRLIQTTRHTWKWKVDFSNLRPDNVADFNRFDLIRETKPEKITNKFISYLEGVHQLKSINSPNLSLMTGISELAVQKYTQKATSRNIIMPYWLFSKLGCDNYYQVCIRNSEYNQRLVQFLESLPKVKVMKSSTFHSYLLFLPAVEVTRLNKRLIIEEKNEGVDILWRRDVTFSPDSIMNGVNLIKTFEMNEK
ncbi:MAG: hypothetical protein ACXAEU_16300 [Candidatus Hodarchaeales archaeon]